MSNIIDLHDSSKTYGLHEANLIRHRTSLHLSRTTLHNGCRLPSMRGLICNGGAKTTWVQTVHHG